MGVINVACTGLELSILPDLGADRLLYLVAWLRRQRPNGVNEGVLKRRAFRYIADC